MSYFSLLSLLLLLSSHTHPYNLVLSFGVMNTPPPPPFDVTAAFQQLLQNQENFQRNQTQLQSNLTTELQHIRTRLGPPGFNNSEITPFPQTSIKLEIPRFDGTDPMGWIFKINQFFDFHHTPEDQRLRIASFYMDGEALTWFQWMHSNGQLLSWSGLLHALESRFAPSLYDDPKGALFKLCQTTIVKEYQTQFETLANRINGLPPQFYLSCFIFGLQPAIRREVQAFQPGTLTQAISLAKLQEEKTLDTRQHPFFHKPNPPTSQTSSSSFRPTLSVAPPRSIPTKKLSQAELQVRHDKGLCYNCDEKFIQGHRCKRLFHLLIVEPDPIPLHEDNPTLNMALMDSEPIPDTTTDLEKDPPQISLHALLGHTIPQTLRVLGHIQKQPVSVLIDSGSTHNFIQDRVMKQLGLNTQPAHSFQVLVGNGEQLQCAALCPQVPLLLGTHKFSVDLFCLPISGAELVLGVQWLKTLGPVLTDYNQLTMSFTFEGERVLLTGQPRPAPDEANLNQLQRMIATDAIASIFQLNLVIASPPSPTEHTEVQIDNLLSKYTTLFSTPAALPPSHKWDHHIPLIDQAPPVMVRPYRYPHFQKKEIESQIKEMLNSGIIQHSSSSFSSPVLLVRKKDGSWRFCVDYRALNAITLKDRFPIPAIDELLDELYGTRWFSKLDLRSGYHQIRMSPEDVQKTAFRTHQGHYEFMVMSFGLCNAPSTFQAAMNHIFHPYLHQFVIVFFDDILVYSPSLETHIEHLEIVFKCLLENQFYLKRSKCSFAQPSIEYLGHIVSFGGVAPDPEKIRVMLSWPTPKTVKHLRGFLGLTGFYRKFVCNYATIAKPLTELLKKDAFDWGAAAQTAFDTLKQAMTEAPVLALPNFEEDFIIETDASGIGMGAVLIQNNHPICYFSKAFCPKMSTASTYVRELCAITSAVKKMENISVGTEVHYLHRSKKPS